MIETTNNYPIAVDYSAKPKFRTSTLTRPAPPAPEAFHGLAGEFVRMVEPHTEADPVALLVQFLVTFGSAIGNSAYFNADGSAHHGNLFAVVCGATSKGRKGTSWAHIARTFRRVLPAFANDRIQDGLSSGEGMIWSVRDPVEKCEPRKVKGHIEGYDMVVTDPGIDDKRLLIVAGEFAQVLRCSGRESNTLSSVMRNAWDGLPVLQTMTKNSPVKATGAHICVIGHITIPELRKELADVEGFNGFGNRFLWIVSERSKLLPHGGKIESVDFSDFDAKLIAAIDHAKTFSLCPRDADANDLWTTIYTELSESSEGLAGAMIARAEAQVMRIALLFALLDCDKWICPQHLIAAKALWDYCERSALFIFGSSTGDKLADKLHAAILRAGDDGLTRAQIRETVGTNSLAAERIVDALKLLSNMGMVEMLNRDTGGRPAELWRAVDTA
jgi:hypothetical protein